jgi:hypothetical protein
MGSGNVRIIGLTSGQTYISEVCDPDVFEAGYLVLKYPGMAQVVQGQGGKIQIILAPVALLDLIADCGKFMERFLLPHTAVLYEAPASAQAVNLYFNYCTLLREQLSGIKVVNRMPAGLQKKGMITMPN